MWGTGGEGTMVAEGKDQEEREVRTMLQGMGRRHPAAERGMSGGGWEGLWMPQAGHTERVGGRLLLGGTCTALKQTQLMFLLPVLLLHVRASLPPSPRVLRAGVIEVSSDRSSGGRNSLHRQKNPEDARRPAPSPDLPPQGLASAYVPSKTHVLPRETGFLPRSLGSCHTNGSPPPWHIQKPSQGNHSCWPGLARDGLQQGATFPRWNC